MANKITAIIDIVAGDARKSLKDLRKDISNTDGVIGKLKVGAKGAFGAIKQNIGAFSLASAGALLAFGDDIINAGVSMEAMDAKAKTVFGDGIGRMETWAEASAGSLGLTERKAIDAGSSIQDLLVPMGFARDAAQQMTLKLLDVSGALSAWSGGKKSVEEVSATLTKAMLGEREELKALGISISEADVQTRLAEKGQKGLTGAALAQAKAIATQELIFEKSTDAQTAWADGSMDATKRANEGKASFAQLGETLNETLYPVLIKLAPAVADLADTAGDAIGPLVALMDVVDKLDGKGFKADFLGIDEELFAVEDMQTEIKALGLDYEHMWSQVKHGDLTLAEVTTRMDEAREAQLALTATLDGGEKSWEGVTGAVEDGSRALDIGTGHLKDLERGADKAEDKVRRLDDAVRSLNGELDAEQAAIDYNEALQEFAEKMYDGEASTLDQYQALVDVKRAALDYVESLKGIPPDKKTAIVAAISAGDLQEVQRLLDELTKQRVVDIRASFSGNSGATKRAPSKGGQTPDGERASGGPVRDGGMYLVGEDGPELFSPGSSGSIIPNRGSGRGSGSGNVTVILNAADKPVRQLWDEMATEGRRRGIPWLG